MKPTKRAVATRRSGSMKKSAETLVDPFAVAQSKEDGQVPPAWTFTEEVDLKSFRVLMLSLKQSGYNGLRAIRLWKCNDGDELIRSLCRYLGKCPNPSVEELQCTDSGVTTVGCDILGKCLSVHGNNRVTFLRLDYNKFGLEGISALCNGLEENETLKHLSLQYCDIPPEGGAAIAKPLIYMKSQLNVLKLRGNYLCREGALEILKAARNAPSLKFISLADNKFGETDDIIDSLMHLFYHCSTLHSYDLSGNDITDLGAEKLLQGILGNGSIKELILPERISSQLMNTIRKNVSGSSRVKNKKPKKKTASAPKKNTR